MLRCRMKLHRLSLFVTSLVLPASLALIAGCMVGWKLINEPKLIYFSNRLDRPRAEIWAGLLFAASAFLFVIRSRVSCGRSASRASCLNNGETLSLPCWRLWCWKLGGLLIKVGTNCAAHDAAGGTL